MQDINVVYDVYLDILKILKPYDWHYIIDNNYVID